MIVRYEMDGGILTSGCAVDGGRVIREGEWLFTVDAVDDEGGRLAVWQGGNCLEVLLMGENLAAMDRVDLIDNVRLPSVR
ncbi:hypothetical protein [Citreimonas sp.]|uniref:hypothetical protein n=1 Tax=Citreimonas sp. TaxID=3036715 RepID=UPI0040598EAE